MENKNLFEQIHSTRGEYSGQAHIAEMIALLGPPPKELFRREREGRKWKWRPAIENAAGKLCERASESYGGPFFDAQGKRNWKCLSNVLRHVQQYPLILNSRRVHAQRAYSDQCQSRGLGHFT